VNALQTWYLAPPCASGVPTLAGRVFAPGWGGPHHCWNCNATVERMSATVDPAALVIPVRSGLTLPQRVKHFKKAFAKWPASWPWLVKEQGRDVAYGVWVIGNDYRNKTPYYGAYPSGYLDRVMALFPELKTPAFPGHVLHVFSGSLPASPHYERCDLVQDAELRCSVYELPKIIQNYHPRLILADPPYSAADAEKYGPPMVDRRRVLAALAEITKPGAHLVWLDTCWPMHRKAQWLTVGRILLQRSTNHRARVISIFERAA
jgi:hypothetical protein